MVASVEFIERIRAEADQWSEAPTLPADIVELLFEERLFKLFVPERFGGKELSLSAAAMFYANLAAADGSVAWLVQIGSGGGFFVPSLPPAVAERLYAPRDAVIAGSGHPTGRARKVAGGYRVSGQWKYASGAQYARVFTANTFLEESNGVRAFAFWREQVDLLDDWQAMGMRATSSWSFRVTDVFVPDELSFVVGEKLWEPGIAVYNVPFLLFAIVSFGAVALGLVRSFCKEAVTILTASDAIDRAQRIAQYGATVSEHEAAFFEIVRRIETKPLEQNSVTNDSLLRIIHRASSIVWNALPFCGMHVVHEKTRLNRMLRDLLVLLQHELLRPRLGAEMPGVESDSEAPVA